MNILYLALDAKCNVDSAEKTHVLEVVRILRQKHRVILVAHALPESRAEDDKETKEIIGSSAIKKGICTDLRIIYALSKYVIREKIDVIYERRASPKISALLSYITSRPGILEVNGDVGKEKMILGVNRSSAKSLESVKDFLSKRLWVRLYGVVVVAREIGESIKEQYRLRDNKVHTVTNGANTELFVPYPKKPAKMKLGLPAEATVIGYAGEFLPWQGLDTLIHSFAIVRKKINNAYLLIIGDGTIRENLHGLSASLGISDYIIWHGREKYEKIPEVLSACDVAVLLRKADLPASPLKLYEYLALGLPVVSTDAPWSSFIREKALGLLVQYGNIAETAEAILTLLQENAFLERVSVESRSYAISNCSWNITVHNLEEILLHSCEAFR